jgi:KinB signaling pathway activation protein
MTLKKWFRLYGITVLLGIIIMLVIGVIRYFFDNNFIDQFQVSNFWYLTLFLILFGSIFGTFSHIMFFCFLVINLIGRSAVYYKFLWQGGQLIIIVYLGVVYLALVKEMYLASFILLMSSALVAYDKARQTNYNAFVPTFFFMTVGSMVALFPVWGSRDELLFIMPAVVVCNAWQIMQLHVLTKKEAETGV